MSPHRQHQCPDLETDEDMRLISRRRLLRQSALGITGVGLVSLLVACGDDDDEDLPAGLDDGGEPPAEDVPTVPVVEEELPADEEDDDD